MELFISVSSDRKQLLTLLEDWWEGAEQGAQAAANPAARIKLAAQIFKLAGTKYKTSRKTLYRALRLPATTLSFLKKGQPATLKPAGASSFGSKALATWFLEEVYTNNSVLIAKSVTFPTLDMGKVIKSLTAEEESEFPSLANADAEEVLVPDTLESLEISPEDVLKYT